MTAAALDGEHHAPAPSAFTKLPRPEAIRLILEGGESVCARAGIPIAGGHTIDSIEPIYGLVVIGIVDSGDAATLGVGAMKPERVKDFYDKMVKAGLYRAGEVDLSKVAAYQFVNKGTGLDLKKKLGVR